MNLSSFQSRSPWILTTCAAALMFSLAALPTRADKGGARRRPSPPPSNTALTLTAAQQTALASARTAIETQSGSVRTNLMAAEVALHAAVVADSPTEATVRAAATKVGGLIGDLAVIQATELAKIHSLFTAEEWAALRLTRLARLD